ncbi:MAG: sigma-70 family RNA polymerase sigma factor [Planctomycetes bacterium]|nr:sigma-70 family RNA polymerase sigma factor [Planctomycetota bacterium]
MARHAKTGGKRKQFDELLLAAQKGRSRHLSFSDLEIPVQPLLKPHEEFRSGRKIRVCLKRLARFLPRHPTGYRRFLARMEEVLAGGGLMFTWLSMRERMLADLKLARSALSRAEALSSRSHRGAVRALEEGVQVLLTYPLDPETLTQWSREVLTQPRSVEPLLKLEQFRRIERILRRTIEALEKERDRLVMPNFRLVLKEVFRYHPTGMKRSDLFQEGILGLQKAVYRYDAERGIRFSTYATYWIRQAIRKSLIDKSRMIRIPQAIQEELRKANSTMQAQEKDRVRKVMSDTILFSYGESDDSSDRFSFEVKDPTVPELGETLHTGTIPAAVQEAMRVLSAREREVLQRRFGLTGDRPQTLEEIGTHLNLSRERIRQIEQEALSRMRRSRSLLEVYEDLDLVECSTGLCHS